MKSLSYVSRASGPLDEAALHALGQEAARLNALDGITGLLLYNGRNFMQTVQGTEDAIDDLMMRLERDPRHHDICVIDERTIVKAEFPSWDMYILMVDGDRTKALQQILKDLPAGPAQRYAEMML